MGEREEKKKTKLFERALTIRKKYVYDSHLISK